MTKKSIIIVIAFIFSSVALTLQAQTPRFGLRSNFLSWVTISPNLGGEVYFLNHWSAAVDGSYGWWGFKGNKDYLQNWSVGGDVNYWFRGGDFIGHHLGLTVRGGQFDYKLGSIGRRGDALLAGINYGYTWHMAGNWFIDTGIGFGYNNLDYDKYSWDEGLNSKVNINSRERNLFGLTNLNVTFIYRFPVGDSNYYKMPWRSKKYEDIPMRSIKYYGLPKK